MNSRINKQRLYNQCLTKPGPAQPAEVVAWLGAVQAQEYAAAKWALALRLSNSPTDADMDRAFDEGRILRTHVMRPTWHFVTPADIHWMRELTAPRIRQAMSSYDRKFGLSAAIRTRANVAIERAFRQNEFSTRAELGAELKRAGVEAKGVQLALLTIHAEIDGIMCSGPRRGRNFTYALLEKRAPVRRRLERDEALAELTRRYFSSHSPATIRDFVWWSGVTTADAKRGLEIVKASCEIIDGLKYWTLGAASVKDAINRTVHLLPAFDEYLVAYQDGRTAHKMSQSSVQLISQNALVVAGEKIGMWKPVPNSTQVDLQVTSWRRLSKREQNELREAAADYGRFLGVPVSINNCSK